MRVPVEGAELYYAVQGAGPVIFILSGIGTKPFERMMPAAMSRRFKLVFIDPRGSGRSTGEPAELTFDRLAADLDAIRRDVGAERVAVLGHSIAGILAIEYARRDPRHVSHAITVGTPPSGDMRDLAAKSAAFFDEDASEERKAILREMSANLSPDASRGERLLAQTPMRFYDARFDAAPLFSEAEVNPAFLAHVIERLAAGWNVLSDASSLRVPLLLAHGRFDYSVPYTLWNGIAEQLPNATFHLFGRSGHQPFVEEPEAFVAVVSDWMTP